MTLNRFIIAAVMLFSVGFLVGCKDSAEKAQEHYENALRLVEQGDDERALVELRNVFKLDGQHRDARQTYARIEKRRGNLSQAYGQYLRLVEQYSDDVEGRRELASMALLASDWAEVERHIKAATDAGIVDDDSVLRAVKVNLDYRNAVLANSATERTAAAEAARELLTSGGDKTLARRVIIQDLVNQKDWPGALIVVDEGLAENPDDRILNTLRLGLLETLGQTDQLESQLRAMLQRFPEDPSVTQNLVRLFLSRNQIDEAETFLREQIGSNEDGSDSRLQLVQFLAVQRGFDAAIAELDTMVALDGPNTALFRAARASMMFDAGQSEPAISELEEVLQTAESSEETHRFMMALAKMYLASDNSVGARALVEKVLNEDPTQVPALKLKAGWLIDDDKPGDALVELNSALDQAPRDPEIMTIMARAHQRAGNTELVAEMLARAVEASHNAPAQSLQFADHLSANKQFLPAEDVLLDALRQQPDNLQILRQLGIVYVRLADAPRLETVIDKLSRLDTPPSNAIANDLKARLLSIQSRTSELDAFLRGLAQNGEGGLQADMAVIRAELADGDIEGALAYTRSLLEKAPDSDDLRFIEAGVLAADGQFLAAEEIYRDLLARNPQRESNWLAMINMKSVQGDSEGAQNVLEEGLQTLPGSSNLMWVKAGDLERGGDIDGAIAIYETLYERNSASVIVANNLASLISSYRDTPENLERAYTIARRLRSTDVPAFQDTYGWIAFKLGNLDEALEYLEPAATALPNEPIAQLHLAETLAALDRNAEALEFYRKALELVQDRPAPLYLERLEAEIARLEAAAE